MKGATHGRRRVLLAAASAGGLLAAAPLGLAGCSVLGPQTPEPPDPLEAPAKRAEADVALARWTADTYPELAAPAGAYALDRQEHAAALRAELRRLDPEPEPTTPSAPPAPPVVTGQQDARDSLAAAMARAQGEAAGLVAAVPGYRAALLASVAACCASHVAVLP